MNPTPFQVSFNNWSADDDFSVKTSFSLAADCSVQYRVTQTCAVANRRAPKIQRSGCRRIQCSTCESSETPRVTAKMDPSTFAVSLRRSASTAQVKGMRLNFAAVNSMKSIVHIKTNVVCWIATAQPYRNKLAENRSIETGGSVNNSRNLRSASGTGGTGRSTLI